MDRGEFPNLTDSQFESVQKMVGIFVGDSLRSLAAKLGGCYAGQAGRTHRGVRHVRERAYRPRTGAADPVAEMKPAQPKPKPLRLKVNPYEGKEVENLHFWVRDVELAMDAALISTDRLRVAFALSGEDLGVHARSDNAGLFHNLGSDVSTAESRLPPGEEYRQRSRFLACKQGKRELHEYIQEMRVLAASLVGKPLPEHIKVTVFTYGLKVGLSRTQLFRVHANTMEEAIQIALQEKYSHRQARTPTAVWQGHNAWSGAVQGAPAAGASTGP
ncbi:LOW QUALITY PROTEIN: Gag protein, partial [Phytophthora palmivora]